MPLSESVPGVLTGTGRNGLPVVRLACADGASAEVCLHGGHVVSWKGASGEEQLFLSRCSHFEAGRAIRGGIPVCFPQFGPGALPQHGFARTAQWRLAESSLRPGGSASATLALTDTEETRALWPYAFRLALTARLGEASLSIGLQARNMDSRPFPFQAVLHTYFAVADIGRTAVEGLQGTTFIDSLRGDAREVETRPAIRFDGETDRIYVATPDRLAISDGAAGRVLHIEKRNMPDVVVWNPWVEKSRRMADFGDDEWQRMVCVETGVIEEPVVLQPGDEWAGETTFTHRLV